MALLSREFIAVPDANKSQIVFKWPDVSIRRFTRAIVEPDEIALFVNRGEVVGTLPPGRHSIDADEIPFLGIFIDAATGGKAYRAELYFIGTHEFTGTKFGGRVDDVQDPHTGLIVTLRVFGQYSIKPVDPAKLITNLTGTVNVSDNLAITEWISSQLLKVARTEITTQIVQNAWPILGLSAYMQELSETLIAAANKEIDKYGLAITGLGNFDINLSEEDEAQLKSLAKDTAYSRLAGSFQQYAAGEAMIGAGEGMAQGGGTGGALFAAGMGVVQGAPGVPIGAAPPGAGFAGGGGNFATVPPAGAPPAVANPGAPSAASQPVEPTGAASGASFVGFCTQCGTGLAEGAKFCSHCGTKVEQ